MTLTQTAALHALRTAGLDWTAPYADIIDTLSDALWSNQSAADQAADEDDTLLDACFDRAETLAAKWAQ